MHTLYTLVQHLELVQQLSDAGADEPRMLSYATNAPCKKSAPEGNGGFCSRLRVSWPLSLVISRREPQSISSSFGTFSSATTSATADTNVSRPDPQELDLGTSLRTSYNLQRMLHFMHNLIYYMMVEYRAKAPHSLSRIRHGWKRGGGTDADRLLPMPPAVMRIDKSAETWMILSTSTQTSWIPA